ncbi:MAG: hypothetical protein KME29_00870 [Calothrix sp. FI2-JRJ7]|jgi:hypothetical protein|nr:hypothetical protein [Calothrix sp. FI2-JRJ7]
MTSSRYQSRLFNFFSRQSQRFGDSVGRTWRTIRVGANWSLEALLYPVFALIQKAVNSADKQLRHAEAPQQKQLNSDNNTIEYQSTPNCDTAIVHMLQMVKKIPSRPENSLNSVAEKLDYVKYHQQLEINDTVKAYLSKVQGIATHLGNKHIVLVTADNKVLDILTLKQQQMIQDKIVAEVAEYWRLWHVFSKQVQSNKNLLPEIDQLLHKLTGGSIIPTEQNLEQNQEIVTQLSTQSYISGLDTFVAHLESSMLSVRRHQNQSLVASIGALVINAINHFFGKSKVNSQVNSEHGEVTNNQLHPSYNATLPKLKQVADETEDLWLTFDDLFGEELRSENQAVSTNKRLAFKTSQKLLNQSCHDEQPATRKVSQMVKSSYIKGNMTYNPKKPAATQQVESDILILNLIDSVKIKQADQIPTSDDKPEFVEIRATSVRYEKHILERILEWLDNLMLWLEDKFVRILKLIQQIFT